MLSYLIRFLQLDGTMMRWRAPATLPAMLIDADVAGHLALKYPTAREDKTDHDHIARYGRGPHRTEFETARGHVVQGGRLVALDYHHPHRGVGPFSAELAPDQWPLGESGWPMAPAKTDLTSTVLGARVLVEMRDGRWVTKDSEGNGSRWCEAMVIGTPSEVLLANGKTVALNTRAARLKGALPDQPFELSANGTAWRRTAKGNACLGRLCDDVATLADHDFSGAGPGSVLIEQDGKWVLLGEVA